MGKYYKMVIDPDDNIHVIINKKGYGKDYHERKQERNRIVRDIYNTILNYGLTCGKEEKLFVSKILQLISGFYYK